MNPEEIAILREIDCPEVPESCRRKRKTPDVGASDVEEEDTTLSRS